jgi:hypothetical protein
MKYNCKTKKKEEEHKNEIYNKLIKNSKAEIEAELEAKMEAKMEDKMEAKMEAKIKDMEKNIKKNHKKEITKLTRKIKILESKKIIVSNNINTGTVNNTTNNNTTNNIVIVGHGKEDMSKIDSADILKVLKNGYNSTIHLTETVHFNPKYPEFQNVYISSMKDKYAMMYNGKKWILITKEALIDKIYNNKKNYIEDNLDKFIESLSKSSVNALKRWLDTDESNPRIIKIKEDIKLLLYNSKDMTLNTFEGNSIQNDDNKIKYVINRSIPHNKKIIITEPENLADDSANESADHSIVFTRIEKYIKK